MLGVKGSNFVQGQKFSPILLILIFQFYVPINETTVLASLTLFCFFFPLHLFLRHIFFVKKQVLTNLNTLKFAVSSVIKIHSNIQELCMRPDYDHLYIPLSSKYGKFQPTLFLGKATLLFKVTAVQIKISEKNDQFFRFETLLPQSSKQKQVYFCHREITSKLCRA